MVEKEHGFSIIFEELGELSGDCEVRLTAEELEEHDEIRALREIVLELQSPGQVYLTTT